MCLKNDRNCSFCHHTRGTGNHFAYFDFQKIDHLKDYSNLVPYPIYLYAF